MKRMNFAPILCKLFGHKWGRWATRTATITRPVGTFPFGQSIEIDTTRKPWGERKCQRCGKIDIGEAPRVRSKMRKVTFDPNAGPAQVGVRIRPATDADTVGLPRDRENAK